MTSRDTLREEIEKALAGRFSDHDTTKVLILAACLAHTDSVLEETAGEVLVNKREINLAAPLQDRNEDSIYNLAFSLAASIIRSKKSTTKTNV